MGAKCPRYQRITMPGCMYDRVSYGLSAIRLYDTMQRQTCHIMCQLHLVLSLPMQSCWHACPSVAKGWQISVFRAAILLVILCSMLSLRSWKRLSFLFSLFSASANNTLPSWDSLPCSLQAGIMMCLTADIVQQARKTCMTCALIPVQSIPVHDVQSDPVKTSF